MSPRPALKHLIFDEDGPTSVEYAVMLAAILLTIYSAIEYFGGAGHGLWGANNQYLEDNVWNQGS